MPIAPEFTSIYSKDWEINFLQCYPNGYLKLTDLCNLLQLTAGTHAQLGGLNFFDMQMHHQAWVLSRMRIEIIELPKWNDTVTVKTWILDMKGSRSVRALEMYVGEKKMVGCLTYWAVFNTKTRKADNLVLPYSHFEFYPDMLPTVESFRKISFNMDTTIVSERKVLLSDLDIVNHANNVKYLEWCMDMVNQKMILKNQLKSLDLNFIKELQYNDTVAIKVAESDFIYTIVNQEKICFALQLYWK